MRDLSLRALTCLVASALALPAQADEPIAAGVAEIEAVDGAGRWFSYGIAVFGAAAGGGIGGWALYDAPLADDGGADPVVFGASLVLVGAAVGQLVHGAMRFDERGISAASARRLIDADAAGGASGRWFLDHRAAEARSTRLWGGVLTTAQGLSTGVLGARLWQAGEGGVETAGIVLTALGALGTGVGVVHFFGRPRAERVRDEAMSAVQVAPAVLPDGGGGLWASGRF